MKRRSLKKQHSSRAEITIISAAPMADSHFDIINASDVMSGKSPLVDNAVLPNQQPTQLNLMDVNVNRDVHSPTRPAPPPPSALPSCQTNCSMRSPDSMVKTIEPTLQPARPAPTVSPGRTIPCRKNSFGTSDQLVSLTKNAMLKNNDSNAVDGKTLENINNKKNKDGIQPKKPPVIKPKPLKKPYTCGQISVKKKNENVDVVKSLILAAKNEQQKPALTFIDEGDGLLTSDTDSLSSEKLSNETTTQILSQANIESLMIVKATNESNLEKKLTQHEKKLSDESEDGLTFTDKKPYSSHRNSKKNRPLSFPSNSMSKSTQYKNKSSSFRRKHHSPPSSPPPPPIDDAALSDLLSSTKDNTYILCSAIPTSDKVHRPPPVKPKRTSLPTSQEAVKSVDTKCNTQVENRKVFDTQIDDETVPVKQAETIVTTTVKDETVGNSKEKALDEESNMKTDGKSQADKEMKEKSKDKVNSPHCKSLITFQSSCIEELSFNEGDVLILCEHVNNDWLFGCLNGKSGLFKKSIVEIIEDIPKHVPHKVHSSNTKKILSNMVARYTFTARNNNELSLHAGDIITNVVKVNEDWLHGDLVSKRGLFPSNYAEIVQSK